MISLPYYISFFINNEKRPAYNENKSAFYYMTDYRFR